MLNGDVVARPHEEDQEEDEEGERPQHEVRVAIVGVGNCASSLIQGVEFYRDSLPDQVIPGLMHPVLGDYHVSSIKFVAAFDVDATKVGQDVSKAVTAGPNNTIQFATVPHMDVTVQRGPHPGWDRFLRQGLGRGVGGPCCGRGGATTQGSGRCGGVLSAGRVAEGDRVLR